MRASLAATVSPAKSLEATLTATFKLGIVLADPPLPAQPSHADASLWKIAFHPVKPFAVRQHHRLPSIPSQRLKPAQTGPSAFGTGTALYDLAKRCSK
jgi:hypothetical protein